MLIATFGGYRSADDWLVQKVVLGNVVGDVVGALVTFILVGLLLRPFAAWIKREWAAHREAQANQRLIADRLDTQTPGGLGDILDALRVSDNDKEKA